MPRKETPTPGQVCYEAFWPSACVPWFTLHPHWHAAWEAAAEAVRDLVRRELVEGFAQRRAEQQAVRAMEEEGEEHG